MSKKGKALIGVLVVLLASLVVWAVRTVPTPPADPGKPQTVMKYDGNTIKEEKDGKVIWELSAEQIDMDTQTQDAVLTNIQGTFYKEDGKTVGLKAPHATYEHKSRNIKMDGGVDMKTSDGATLTSKEMTWEAAKSMLAATGDVKMDRESDHMKAAGDRIESTDAFEKIKIIGKAHIEKGN